MQNLILANGNQATISQPDGTDRTREQTFVTPKGLAKLAMMIGVQPDIFGGA